MSDFVVGCPRSKNSATKVHHLVCEKCEDVGECREYWVWKREVFEGQPDECPECRKEEENERT